MASIQKNAAENTEELLVFGYSCKLFRDDEKALFIENGNHLIPWMGDQSMMIDRYDVRGALYDLDAAASIGSPVALTEVEQKEEELAEYERYLALHYDLEATAEREEEETKRLHMELASGASDFNQVEYSYEAAPAGAVVTGTPHLQQHPQPGGGTEQRLSPTTAVPPIPQAPQQDAFILPASLVLPPGMTVPTTLKQHKIIVKTAGFIAKQGSQMEIVLKTKQTGNALFGFLSFDNCLNRYYKHIVALIKSGRYHEEEQQEEEASSDVPVASFNPSADAAPGSATPSKATSTVSADCSYSKLISKIKENQAKQSQSQASANVDPNLQQEKNSAQSSPVVTNTDENSSSTPVVAAASVTVAKPFMGLVDYPSFNQADESDYSGSESDSQPSALTQALPAQNGDIKTKKSPVSKESNPSKKKSNDVARSDKKNADDNAENFDDIKWPSPREQMVIDKIACYIVKNGAKFEQAIKARGDARFHFLKNGHEFNAYFELKRSLLTEVFGVCISNSASKRAESAKDMKTVVAASKSMPSTQKTRPALPTISFKLKQRRDQECALPPTSFPLESSSSEEDLENLDADEREKREQQRQERRQWRQMKREQFEREKRERKLREEKEKEEREARMREEQASREKMLQNSDTESDRLKALQEEENASADEEMYDIFKYAQENETVEQDKGDSCDVPEEPVRAGRGSDKRLKRKKAAHAFISKLRVGPEPAPPQPHIIGPQLPPEIAALMMAATTSPPPPPSPVPSSPSLTPPPSCAQNSSPVPHPSCVPSPRTSRTPSRSPSPAEQPPHNGVCAEQPVETAAGSATPPLSSASVSSLPSIGGAPAMKKPTGLLAAAVTSLLSNDEAGVSNLVAASPSQASSALSRYGGSRSSRAKKRKSSKRRHDRSVSVSPDRPSSTVSSKKRKRKHHRHQRSSHKKRRHHSAHSSSKKSSSHSSSAKKKSKKKKSKSSKKGKHKKSSSRRRRSESGSPYSSDEESSIYSQSSSESDGSSESYASRKRRSVSNEEDDAQTEDEIQVIDSDSSSSSVQSVRSSVPRSLAPIVVATTTTTASSRASSASRDTLLALETKPVDVSASAADSPSAASTKVSLPAGFDLKSSSALAKISEGLRAKVHALMEKKRPSE